MCRSDPQIAVVVTLTMASCGLRMTGSATSSTRMFSLPSQQTARMMWPLRSGRPARNLTGLEQLPEMPQILTDNLRRLPLEESGDECSGLPCRRRELQIHADLGASTAAHAIEAH